MVYVSLHWSFSCCDNDNAFKLNPTWNLAKELPTIQEMNNRTEILSILWNL